MATNHDPTRRLPTSSDLQPPLPSPPRNTNKPVPTHLYNRLPSHQLLEDGTPDYLKLILGSKVYDLVQETPLHEAFNLGNRLGVWVGLKREDLQPVFSNHAQGVAMSAKALGMKATIVMPLATPSIKYKNVSRLGSSVLLHGSDFDEAKRECGTRAIEGGLTNVPPFDEPYVIAGQGTIGLEILKQTDMHTLDAIFVCVGGGGLLAGIAAYVKGIAPPSLKVIGVECEDQTAMRDSLLKGERVVLKEVGLFSDGTAVRVVGEETFRVCKTLVDEMVIVTNDELCASIKDVFEDTRSIPEPAGSLAVAGMKRYVHQNKLIGSGKRFVAIVSGANMNFDRLRFVAERADLGDDREALLSVVVPEKPGSFVKLHSYIQPRAVTEFSYRFSSSNQASIFVSFRLSSQSRDDQNVPDPKSHRQRELSSVIEAISTDPLGMIPRDISDNEMAKSHARYLVGGKILSYLSLLFNLTNLKPSVNHGADMSRVLAGIQVPKIDTDRFERFLEKLGYPFTDETENVSEINQLCPGFAFSY
ncbi:hypothetical protein CROQUDRAFT_672821 [Cronartium quercuum f. sp. fusiforme G11]|uniref:Threonine dehydratase n=1 Tax=Cronartium quercuum f. sp. fusiforme G11 TaxID=708437 RepID=A0A9P6T904_9BASI|nr:hypothetical protein CROQUDRAFT_672821 [Cronartium quercuum f. sp. fusiforme G11]